MPSQNWDICMEFGRPLTGTTQWNVTNLGKLTKFYVIHLLAFPESALLLSSGTGNVIWTICKLGPSLLINFGTGNLGPPLERSTLFSSSYVISPGPDPTGLGFGMGCPYPSLHSVLNRVSRPSLWRRANAWNVSFFNFFTVANSLSTQLIKPNYLVSRPLPWSRKQQENE